MLLLRHYIRLIRLRKVSDRVTNLTSLKLCGTVFQSVLQSFVFSAQLPADRVGESATSTLSQRRSRVFLSTLLRINRSDPVIQPAVDMGTLIGHVIPGVGFLFIGIWHLLNTIRNYVEAPWNFQGRIWYPARWTGKYTKYLKYMELYLIIFGSMLSIAAELFICPRKHQPFADDWSIPREHLNNFEHSSISLFFCLYGLACLGCDVLKIHVPRGTLHVLAVLALSQELLLFHFHSADHMGLEGHYHWLLQLPIAVAVLTALLEVVAPHVFINSFIGSVSIIFQGSWFVQMGLTLWVQSIVPKGCEMYETENHFEVRCLTDEAGMRAKALANLAFSWHLAVILLMSVLVYVAMVYHHSSQQLQYEPLLSNLDKEQQHSKNVGGSPRSTNNDGSQSIESDVEMQGMPALSLER